jgi:hypothetical protein
MNLFREADKTYISLSYRAHGKTHSVDMELTDDCTWGEVLNPIIATLEAAYGYSFDLESEDLGIYYSGKE